MFDSDKPLSLLLSKPFCKLAFCKRELRNNP